MEKEILITAIRGLDGPYYNLIDKYTRLGLGGYCGGFVDSWRWNSLDTMSKILNNYTEQELTDMFNEIRDSWK